MRIRIKRKLKESSSSGGMTGYAGVPLSTKEEVDEFNKKEEENQRLKGERLDEMFSSSTQTGGFRHPDPEDECAEHCGRVERDPFNKVYKEDNDDEETIDLKDPDAMDRLANFLDDDEEEELPSLDSPMAQLHPVLHWEILDHGYEITQVLGRGKFGTVFAAEDVNTGGDYVVKVVGVGEDVGRGGPLAVRRELDNYATISEIASGDEAIWKHFPEVYETWHQSLSNVRTGGSGRSARVTGKIPLGFIVMEKLVPLTDTESAFIPDLNYVVAQQLQGLQGLSGEKSARDQSLKAKSYLKPSPDGPDGRGGIENMSYNTTETIDRYWISSGMAVNKDDFRDDAHYERTLQKIEKIKKSISPEFLYRYEKYQEVNPDAIDFLIRKRIEYITEIFGADDDENRDREFEPHVLDGYRILQSEVQDAPYAHLILLDLITALIKAAQLHPSTYIREWMLGQDVEGLSADFIRGIRNVSSIPLGYSPDEAKKYSSEHGKINFGPEARDLFKAIRLLYKKSGIYPRDVHDANVMKRLGSGDIVIVDLGLFRTDPEWREPAQFADEEDKKLSESRRYRIKILTKPRK